MWTEIFQENQQMENMPKPRTRHHLCANINIFMEARRQANRCPCTLLHRKCSKCGAMTGGMILYYYFTADLCYALKWENTGSPELPAFSSLPRQALLGLSGPKAEHLRNSHSWGTPRMLSHRIRLQLLGVAGA